jgi:hypothetical protein
MSASGVLASLRGSTYRGVRFASSLAAALLDGLFEHPVDSWIRFVNFERSRGGAWQDRFSTTCL